MTGVDGTANRKKAKCRKIIHHNLRSIIESRHVLCGILCTLKSRVTATTYRLYLSAIELLPIGIIFIDRIIDRIWISAVTLTTEFFQP